ncbi:MAG TPA: hypothetical protein VFM79_13580 [Pelobium sp.]|nr:hypothetical protein [Pelobium sp.]
MNKVILLDKRPVGKATLTDFKFAEAEMPPVNKGEVLLKLCMFLLIPI